MRTSALIALLPFIATTAVARPCHSEESTPASLRARKSLSFGPSHSHAKFELVDEPASPDFTTLLAGQSFQAKDVVAAFLESKLGFREGSEYYIRDDSYTDARTGVAHLYVRQLVNGLEVSDGDINLNIDRDGRVISWGNSFHPGSAPSLSDVHAPSSGESERLCSILEDNIESHNAQLAELKGETGAWGFVKSTAQNIFGISLPSKKQLDHHAIRRLHKSSKHLEDHSDAVCQPLVSGGIMSPAEGLVSLLSRVANDNLRDISADELESTPQHSLKAKPAPAEPPTEIISGLALAEAGVMSDVPARLMYTQVSDAEPRLVWKYEVEMKDTWYEAYVDVYSGELLRIVDWASDFDFSELQEELDQLKDDIKELKGGKQKPLPSPPSKLEPYSYQVFPWGVNDPEVGNLSIVTKPWDTAASPLGWHQFPTSANPWSTFDLPGQTTDSNYTTFNTTVGNNVYAHEDWEGRNNFLNNYRPLNDSHIFVYDYGAEEGLAPKEYIDLVVTQLFYTSNMYHDLLYRYGFDEISGNFQAHNFGLGGKGGDPVITNAQDGSGYNNANFMTPPDGTPGRMRMYIWDTATPYRDGDLEAGIVIHEYSHGVSTRLTGGPANSGCLGYGEAGGMGEGWGDALASLIRQVEEHKNFENNTDKFSMGAWAANTDKGIRPYKYSTNSTVNPHTYKALDKYWGVHDIGAVWAELLFVLNERLIEEYGFSKTLFPPTNTSESNDFYTATKEASVDSKGHPIPLIPKHGNTLAFQLIIDGMKLQPCRPSFFDARDAIIQADQILTGGENACIIWKAFAERGLGVDASLIGNTPWGGGVRADGYHVPKKICKTK
ncbi:extracellular elastinolytic metalloproteinase [Cryptococcus wingfieldii CBS 7118]|uniref:Extracellular metalloproteinase n=1 Tax=Cryptococcus wingfieldii CBS 7118 TaxID=1295528 RepID=A0A1E3K637_9TREE|nr:extracellular elastinolytic metalloproteinase [Cryptococcus wingfieldii CBS 7118]ODO08638.1 extracellular elastinolytic metalloproteinase [Cryptococcus wingfieldii CBS 7118]